MRTEGSSLCHANVVICEESAEFGASMIEELAYSTVAKSQYLKRG